MHVTDPYIYIRPHSHFFVFVQKWRENVRFCGAVHTIPLKNATSRNWEDNDFFKKLVFSIGMLALIIAMKGTTTGWLKRGTTMYLGGQALEPEMFLSQFIIQ